MAGATEGVILEGFTGLQRSLKAMGRDAAVLMRGTLMEVAEPVRRDAELLTGKEIRNILSPTAEVDWWRMRTGVTMHTVYVAPKEHGHHGLNGRPNLAPLLLERGLIPALDKNRDNVVRGVEHMLDALAAKNGF